MRAYLTPLLQLQRFFLPALLILTVWAIWRTVWKRDLAVGLALYLGLVIIVDGFMNTGLYLPGIEKGSIRYSEICALFLLAYRPAASPRRGPYGLVCLLVGVYFLLMFVATLRADPLMTGVFDFRRLIVPQVTAFIVALRALRSPDDVRRFLMSVVALSLLLGLFVFWDLFFDYWLLKSDTLNTPMYGMNRKHGRYGSFFLNPNYLGAFIVLVFPVLFVWLLGEKVPRAKLLGVAGLLALVFCLVETKSRGPLLAFGVALVLLLLGPAGTVSRTRRFAVFIPFVLLFSLLMPGFYETAMRRFDSVDQELSTEGARTRHTVWLYTQRAIGENPIMGIGFGEQQFIKTMEDYGYKEEFGDEPLDNPHNSYLQMAVYAGIPSVVVFLLANLVLLLWAARAIVGRLAGEFGPIAFGMAVGVAGFLAVIYPDMHMFAQTVAPVYWVVFGLLLSATTTAPAVQAKQPVVRHPVARHPLPAVRHA